MRIPLRYSLRNLARRKWRTLLTVFAVALVTAVSVFMFAFSRGILHSARNSGSPDNVMVISRHAANAGFSKIRLEDYNLLKSLPQIKRGQDGEPLISPEAIHQCPVSIGTEHIDRPGTVRGLLPVAFSVNERLKIVEGDPPSPGRRVIVGELAHATLGVPKEALAIGAELAFQNETWTVVGRFSADGSAQDSEILADLNDVMAVFNRDSYSSVLLKVGDLSDVEPLIQSLNSRNDVIVKAVSEADYYRELQEGYQRIIFLAIAMAVIASVGGLVSGMNTMYASVLGRIREIGTLKVLGFGGSDIVLSFVLESLLIAAIGGVLGCGAAFAANGIPTKFAMSAFSVRVDEVAVGAGMGVAALIGLVGALPPSWRGVRMAITASLRYSA